jgi:hypothetical protein
VAESRRGGPSERYGDVLGALMDQETTSIVEILDAGYGSIRAPERIRWWTRTATASRLQRSSRLERVASTAASRRTKYRLGLVVLLAALVTGGIALSATNLTDLGKPSNSAAPFLPLGSFRHTTINPHLGKKAQLIFLGTQIDDSSAVERWAVVKALSQFGTFSKIRPLSTHLCQVTFGPSNPTGPSPGHEHAKLDCNLSLRSWGIGPGPMGSSASFELRGSEYSSPYLAFSTAELIDRNLKTALQGHLTRSQLTLFDRYIRLSGDSVWHQAVWHSVPGLYEYLTLANRGRQLPLAAVGGYVETGANVAISADLFSADHLHYLSFRQMQTALRAGKPADGASDTLVPDVNAEANIITALICHADGRKPSKVCDRPVIRSMLKHVK